MTTETNLKKQNQLLRNRLKQQQSMIDSWKSIQNTIRYQRTLKLQADVSLAKNSLERQKAFLKKTNELVDDLGWDRDRMSESGKECYDKLCKLLKASRLELKK